MSVRPNHSCFTAWLCRQPVLQLGQLELVLGARAKAGDVEDSVYSSVYSAVCGGVDSRMASVCSNLSVEISCADVAVAWSLPPACDEKKIVSAAENCKSNQIEHVFMNTKNRSTKPGPRQAEKPELRKLKPNKKTRTAKAQAEKPELRKLKQNQKTRTAKAQAEKPEPRKLKPN